MSMFKADFTYFVQKRINTLKTYDSRLEDKRFQITISILLAQTIVASTVSFFQLDCAFEKLY